MMVYVCGKLGVVVPLRLNMLQDSYGRLCGPKFTWDPEGHCLNLILVR